MFRTARHAAFSYIHRRLMTVHADYLIHNILSFILFLTRPLLPT